MALSFRFSNESPVSSHLSPSFLKALGMTLILLLSIGTSFRSPQLPPSAHGWQWSVFGSDHRREVVLDHSPLQAIGRIELQPEGVIPWLHTGGIPICTGTLVGIDLVLTNAHCVLDRETGLPTKKAIWFRPAFHRDSPPRAARATKLWLGSMKPSQDRAHDFALLRLDQPYGESYSWLELAPLPESPSTLPLTTSLVAYGTDVQDGGVPLIHRDCALTAFDVRGDYFRHDCDMNAGGSGGPLLTMTGGRPRIFAINAAHIVPKPISYLNEFTPELANVAVGSHRFAAVIDSLRQDLPLPSHVQLFPIDLSPLLSSDSLTGVRASAAVP